MGTRGSRVVPGTSPSLPIPALFPDSATLTAVLDGSEQSENSVVLKEMRPSLKESGTE